MKSLHSILLVIASAVLTGSCLAEQGKQDIRGFTPGISFAEAGRIVKDKRYSCTNFSQEVIPYGINCENFTLWFSTVLNGAPLLTVFTELRTTSTIEEIVQSLSEQYSKKAIELKPDGSTTFGYVWELGDKKILRLISNGRQVHLYDDGLLDKDEEEKFRRSRVPVPRL